MVRGYYLPNSPQPHPTLPHTLHGSGGSSIPYYTKPQTWLYKTAITQHTIPVQCSRCLDNASRPSKLVSYFDQAMQMSVCRHWHWRCRVMTAPASVSWSYCQVLGSGSGSDWVRASREQETSFASCPACNSETHKLHVTAVSCINWGFSCGVGWGGTGGGCTINRCTDFRGLIIWLCTVQW